MDARIRGRLIRGIVSIEDEASCKELNSRGYGEYVDGRFELEDFEALYLVYVQRLEIRGRTSDFDGLVREYKRAGRDVLTRFLVYRDLKTRGYVVKGGFGFGSDFRVYERGKFGQKGAKYLVFAFNEGRRERVSAIRKNVQQITQMGKEPIIAVIERRGEVIYYRIACMTFRNP